MGETDAAAGFIYLLLPRWHRKSFRFATRFPMPTTHEQSDFAHAKYFVLCSFQPTKSACSAAAEKCLSCVVGQPISSVSGRKRCTFRQRFRYNDYTTINKLSQAFRHRFSEFFQFHFSRPDKLTTEYYRNILSQKVHLLKQGFDYSHLKSERGNTF